jgi:hypothetical protein
MESCPVLRAVAAIKASIGGVNVRGQTFLDPNEIAQTQLVRFRCRLGTLRNEQELQIEDLLISTITKISLITGRVMELPSENSGRKAGRSDCDINVFTIFEEQ